MDFNIALGFLGLFIIFVAYLLNNYNFFKKNKKEYYLCNLLGSFLLAYYSFTIGSIPFLTLQIFWGLASTHSLLKS